MVIGGEGSGNTFKRIGGVLRPQIGYHSTLTKISQTEFDFFTKAHVQYRFEREPALTGEVYTLRFIQEPNGNRMTFDYLSGDGDPVTLDAVTDSSGRSLVFEYQDSVMGPDGSVVATDISPDMIAYGRERAAQAGLENVEFVESAAASLDFPQGNFDAALSRWGIIFEPEAEAVAGRIRSFLKPGGRFAISSWGPPERVPMIALPMKIASEQLDVPLPPPGTPGPLSRPTPEALGGLLEAAGFADVTVEEADVPLEWDSPEDFTTFNREIVPPLRAILAERPEEQQERALSAITEAARASSGEAGEVRLSNLALLAVGRA